MAFDFTPTDGLLNTTSFPQKPANQTNARQQFMTPFNQIKAYLNGDLITPNYSTPTFLNGWSYAGTFTYYFKDGTNRVGFDGGDISGGTIGSPAFQLPAGYRPLYTKRFACISNGALSYVYIDPSGNVVPAGGSNAGVCLAPIRFLARQ